MAKHKKSGRKQQEPESATGKSQGGSAARSREGTPRGGVRSWWRRNRSDVRFLAVFGLCMGIYYLATLTGPIKDGFFPAYLRLNAQVSGVMLRVMGEDVSVRDQSMISAEGPAIEIERGCDAVEPSALFVSAVLASPVPLLARLSAALAGTLLLMILNFVRVISLFLVRVYYPKAFETMHVDVWQALFILLAIMIWAIWASRMSRKRAAQADAST